ncbi:MAG: adenylate/guanylate cyclase domain-containing protein [Thiogranum sp.]|nr:adenylate/guanylate cyclase domain-containing protein [Thiogranum sp.]
MTDAFRLHGGKWLPAGTGLLLVALLLAATLVSWPPVQQVIERLELLTYDIRLNYAPLPRERDTARIVIVDIDERSLQQQGRWPWPRDQVGQLMQRLNDAGAAVIAFDVLFSEPDRNPAIDVLDYLVAGDQGHELRAGLQNLSLELDRDRRFAAQLGDRDVVLGMLFHREDSPSVGALPVPLQVLDTLRSGRLTAYDLPRFTGTLPALLEAVPAVGFLNTRPDVDGTIRRSPLLIRHGTGLYPSLALETARLYQLLDSIRLETAPIAEREVLEAVHLGDARIPTDAAGNVLIPYRGPPGTFATVSAADLLAGRPVATLLENAVVIIGTSAIGLADLRPTPVGSVFPGVEIQATLLDGILNGGLPMEPAWAPGVNFAAMLAVGVGLAIVLPFLGPLTLTGLTVLIMALWTGINVWLWREQGLALHLASPLLMVVALAMLNMLYGFQFESRRRNQLKSLFGQYVPAELVEEMSRAPEHYHSEGESRELSVLFADIRNFTGISESLSAGDLKEMLNRFFTPMTRIIFNHRGTIDKYVGDMIMAFWGAPIAAAQHADQAVSAAMAMLHEVKTLQPELRALGYPEISIGIGINTGMMNVGDMGSVYRRAYTVIGDAVNLASRLEGLTKFYGVSLVVGEQTRAQASGFVYRRLDRVRVKGKRSAETVYEPVCRTGELTDALSHELAAHDAAMELFWQRHWDQASVAFGRLAAQHPDRRLYALYLQRIDELRARDLPDDWDGVYDRREK